MFPLIYLLFILILILSAVFILWLVIFFLLTDFSYPYVSTSEFKKVLLIFPHPDDEVLTCGGLIRKFASQKKQITYLCLTKGEKGQEGATFNPTLAKIRSREAEKVAKILKITKLILDDFGDGELKNKKNVIKKRIREVIQNENPDLILTYDLSGLYGHDDHIVVSEIVTSLVKNTNTIKLWYVSFPPKFYRFTHLPTHMASGPNFMKKQSRPSAKFFVGLDSLTKIKALYTYKSQLFAFKKGNPKFFPLWFILSTRLFEYYNFPS